MPPLSFEERASSGCYDNLARIFDGSSDSLAKVDYDTHFTGKSSTWQSDGDAINHRTTFFLLDQTSEEGTPRELVVNIIGEVAREGNKLGALGNAWLKPNKKLVDANSARDVLVLILPTKATESLEVLYENQIRTIEELEDKIALPVPKVYVTLSM